MLLAFRWLLILEILALIAACAPPASPPPSGPAATPVPASGGDRAADRAAIAQFEQEVRALAKVDGCADSGQCKAAPVGAKACGGPRLWLPYCPMTTDVPALMNRLSALQGAEQQFNRTYGVVSDCSYVAEPTLTAAGGSCRVR